MHIECTQMAKIHYSLKPWGVIFGIQPLQPMPKHTSGFESFVAT